LNTVYEADLTRTTDDLTHLKNQLQNTQLQLTRKQEDLNHDALLNASKIETLVNENSNIKLSIDKKTKTNESLKTELAVLNDKFTKKVEETNDSIKNKETA